ncbi:MAG: PRC-barrel domain protein [Methanocella sp. PtaU1.Bin125]|nr:MAG: PRC-barrel domain protein [Methanocella sp. PtaU1.Bin125]
MIDDITSLFDLNVYTDKGVYAGKVADVQIDASERRIAMLALSNYNKDLFTIESRTILVPYRIVTAAKDIVIIKHQPIELWSSGRTTGSPLDEVPEGR